MAYRAEIILDSVSPAGDRLTTFQIQYPRMVHSEFMTHRVFSRNAASSRAIPVAKTIQKVLDDPVIPVEWGMNQKGMQASELADKATQRSAELRWLAARDEAVCQAENLLDLGIHKQIVNRLLEPWSWITAVVTATEWDGFWAQRCSRYSPLAQPELRRVADMMLEAYEASVPGLVKDGEWHTPYIQLDEDFEIEDRKKISAARTARVSYLSQNGVRDPEEDLAMYGRLVSAKPLHASPLEHVATPDGDYYDPPQGNFTGWAQLRHDVESELSGV